MALEIKTQIIIFAKPEKVWEVFASYEDYPNWNPFIKSIVGSVRVGEKIKVEISPPEGKGMTFKPKVLTRIYN